MKLAIVLLCLAAVPSSFAATPSVDVTPSELRVTGREYRLTAGRFACQFGLELRDGQGAWRRIAEQGAQAEFALTEGTALRSSAGNPARLEHAVRDGCVVIGVTTALSVEPLRVATIHFLCVEEGVLAGMTLNGPGLAETASCWPLPRWPLDGSLFGAYGYWNGSDEFRSGAIGSLGEREAYAGVSAWGGRGDTAPRLSGRHPALIAQAREAGTGLGVVFLRYEPDWAGSHCFLQRYTPQSLFLYSAIAPAKPAGAVRWAWLAPFPETDSTTLAGKVERLLTRGEELRQGFHSIAPEPVRAWTEPVPDFPAALRRKEPVNDIRDAAVFTIHETMDSDDGIRAGAKVGSDLWIRAWFKWHQARDYLPMAHLVPKAHALGALFGGGVTCSALYDGENGLTQAQIEDLATRGPDGRLVDAWGEAGCRHGTLSNPAYLEYLLSWCRNQIDAGVDYLFMDEINAALQHEEGFDDYSLRDFRAHLLRAYVEGKGWAPNDARWRDDFRVDCGDRELCPAGTMGSFDYRAYLRKQDLVSKPLDSNGNPFVPEWHRFRRERDDRAWKWLTDAIRAHAAAKGRRVLISGNGLARYVDLQVLGVWGHWRVKDGAVDLGRCQIDDWASTVAAGRSLARARVPVVFFHDWGFNGFPWMEVAPPQRELWLRVRGAEIYAAGGFFAFPVHGPMNNDALRDGTIAQVARQTAFYQQNRALYLDGRLLGLEPLESDQSLLSKALWVREKNPALVLHVINRQTVGDRLQAREKVEIRLPTDRLPRAVRIVSPDWEGEQAGEARVVDGKVAVTIARLEAYAVAVLEYEKLPELRMAGVKIVPMGRWERPEQSEFVVEPGGVVRDAAGLPSFLHGNLHSVLRNPPEFLLSMPRGGKMLVHVRSVATLGAKLECLIDGTLAETVDLPDLDHKNDSSAAEYDRTLEFSIPSGRHRVTLRNSGGDWAYLGWYAFEGELTNPIVR